MNVDFLGKGFATPLRANAQGGIQVSSQEQKVKESIQTILGTQYGERVMRPKFGCNLRSLVFAPNDVATANLARHYVEDALKTWEPRILLDEVVVENDNENGQLIIYIHYKLKSTYELQNIVYPFDLKPQ